MNKYEVVIKRANGSASTMSAVAMNEEEARGQVIAKQSRKVREAIAEGEYTVEVIGDAGNK
jgi:hypothetical protein